MRLRNNAFRPCIPIGRGSGLKIHTVCVQIAPGARSERKERKLVKLKLKNSHGGFAGRSLIERIQAQLDKQNARLHAMEADFKPYDTNIHATLQGRVEGMAATLAILRSSSLQFELEQSKGRLK